MENRGRKRNQREKENTSKMHRKQAVGRNSRIKELNREEEKTSQRERIREIYKTSHIEIARVY